MEKNQERKLEQQAVLRVTEPDDEEIKKKKSLVPWYMLNGTTKKMMAWNMLITLLLIYNMVMTPYL